MTDITLKKITMTRSLLICVSAFLAITQLYSQPDLPDWSVNPGEFSYEGSVTALVYIEGELVNSESDLVAGFADGQCRGTAVGTILPGIYTVFMLMLYSNIVQGETMSFLHYNSDTGVITPLSTTIAFSQNMILGTPLSPFEVTTPTQTGIEFWTVNPADYVDDGAITAAVFLNGVRQNNPQDLLAGFAGGYCCGAANGIMLPDTDEMIFMLQLYTNELQQPVNFLYYNAAGGQIFAPDESITLYPDLMLGDPLQPFVFHTGEILLDCSGEPGGDALIDDCGICSGGTTGIEPDIDLDDCGVCYGENNCFGCSDPNALNYSPEVSNDDGSCLYIGDCDEDGDIDVSDIIQMISQILDQ